MFRYEAANLCIEEVEKLSKEQAKEYLLAMNPSFAGASNPAECLKEGFPDGQMPGLLEQIALRILMKE